MDGRTDGRTDDGQKVITIAHPEHSSGELIKHTHTYIHPHTGACMHTHKHTHTHTHTQSMGVSKGMKENVFHLLSSFADIP